MKYELCVRSLEALSISIIKGMNGSEFLATDP
jgi:hypothetical protein